MRALIVGVCAHAHVSEVSAGHSSPICTVTTERNTWDTSFAPDYKFHQLRRASVLLPSSCF